MLDASGTPHRQRLSDSRLRSPTRFAELRRLRLRKVCCFAIMLCACRVDEQPLTPRTDAENEAPKPDDGEMTFL